MDAIVAIIDGEERTAGQVACATFLRQAKDLRDGEDDSRCFTIPGIDWALWEEIEYKYGESGLFKLEYLGPSQSAIVSWPHPLHSCFNSMADVFQQLQLAAPTDGPFHSRPRCAWNLDVHFSSWPHQRSMRIPDFQFITPDPNHSERLMIIECAVGQKPEYLREKVAMWRTHPQVLMVIALDIKSAAPFVPPTTRPVEGAHHWSSEEIRALEREPHGTVVFHDHCWAQEIETLTVSLYQGEWTKSYDLTPAPAGDTAREERLKSDQVRCTQQISRAAAFMVGNDHFNACFAQKPFDLRWDLVYRDLRYAQCELAFRRYSSWYPDPAPLAPPRVAKTVLFSDIMREMKGSTSDNSTPDQENLP
ncbi:hypothetical protein DFH06DRAFT_1239292 [Mycena polygramma]|nr:hypothetical protein DFH06DRAFT_1239292 [Mycena polygramma]